MLFLSKQQIWIKFPIQRMNYMENIPTRYLCIDTVWWRKGIPDLKKKYYGKRITPENRKEKNILDKPLLQHSKNKTKTKEKSNLRIFQTK